MRNRRGKEEERNLLRFKSGVHGKNPLLLLRVLSDGRRKERGFMAHKVANAREIPSNYVSAGNTELSSDPYSSIDVNRRMAQVMCIPGYGSG